ncbi:MAG: hypothetical protein HWE12_12930 [Oceanospirillaceae bacterium]|nr:hypothetical protein [Oceanospirillaceae bacterium]
MARPSKYTPKLGSIICWRLAGGESLRSICRDPSMPANSTVLLWIVDGNHSDFSEQYRMAREAAGYAHADRLIEIVERVEVGELSPASARVMADQLKWSAERMAPKAHSSRQDLNIRSTCLSHEEALTMLC